MIKGTQTLSATKKKKLNAREENPIISMSDFLLFNSFF